MFENNHEKKIIRRKKDYIRFNYGKYIDKKLKKKDCRVVEIGPGQGDFVEYCKDRGVDKIDVVDNDKKILSTIKQKYVNTRTLYSKKITLLDSRLDRYDIIVMTQVLEHIQKKEHIPTLKTLSRHLKKGGVFIITVPNIGNPLGIFERYYDYTHETAFTESSLKQLVRLSSLRNVDITFQAFRIPPYDPVNMVRIVFQSLLHGLFRMIYLANGGVYPSIMTTNITCIIGKNAATRQLPYV